MINTREKVIKRTIEEYERLDAPVANSSNVECEKLVPRSVTKNIGTVKVVGAHITQGKAEVLRRAKWLPVPEEQTGLNWRDGNRRCVPALIKTQMETRIGIIRLNS